MLGDIIKKALRTFRKSPQRFFSSQPPPLSTLKNAIAFFKVTGY